MSYLTLPESAMSTLVMNWLVFDNSLAGVEGMSRPLMWRCRASPAAVGVVVLVHRRADQSLLSQSAPRSHDSSPLDNANLLPTIFKKFHPKESFALFKLYSTPLVD